MLLREWLILRKVPIAEMADRLGVHSSAVYRWLGHDRRMHAELAVKIEQITDGDVSRTEALWPEKFE